VRERLRWWVSVAGWVWIGSVKSVLVWCCAVGFTVESRSRSIVKMTCETAKVMQRAKNMVSIVPASFVNFFSLHSRITKFWVERREIRTFELRPSWVYDWGQYLQTCLRVKRREGSFYCRDQTQDRTRMLPRWHIVCFPLTGPQNWQGICPL
jgi:hypothetical protein